MASLPYYEDKEASMVLPRGLVEKNSMHKMRMTYLGTTCHAPQAAVHTAEIHIHAEGSTQHMRADFKAALASKLVNGAQVDPSRLQVSSLRAGSTPIEAQITVLPAAVNLGMQPAAQPSAEEAVANLKAALQTEHFNQDLCALADSTETSCHASLVKHGPARPLLTREKPAGIESATLAALTTEQKEQ